MEGLTEAFGCAEHGHEELEKNTSNNQLYRIVAIILFGATAIISLLCSLKKKINCFNKSLGVQIPHRAPA